MSNFEGGSSSSQLKQFSKRGRTLRRNAKNILDSSMSENINSAQNISSSYQIDDPLNDYQDDEESNQIDLKGSIQQSNISKTKKSTIISDRYQQVGASQDQVEFYYGEKKPIESDEVFEENLQVTVKLTKLKRYDEAILQLEKIISSTSNAFCRSRAKCQLGTVYQLIQREDLAIDAYVQSLSDNILNETTHLNVGILYLQRYLQNRVENNKCISNALNHLNQSLKLNPKSYEGNFHIANAFLEQNNQSQAEVYLNKCTKLDIHNPKAYRVLAGIYQDQKKFEKAKECYNKAIAIRPTDKDYYNIGLVYMSQNNFLEAQQCFIKCLSVNSNFVNALVNLGLLHFINNEFEEAEKLYTQALQIDAFSFEALSNMGNLLYSKKELLSAEKFYIKAAEVDKQSSKHKQSPYLLLNLGRAQFELNKLEEALENILLAYQLDEQLYYALKIISEIFILQNQFMKAESYLEKYMQIVKSDVDALFKLATVQYKTFQYNKSQQNLQLCLKLKPNHTKALKMLNELNNVLQ